jgi:hypothetical protein
MTFDWHTARAGELDLAVEELLTRFPKVFEDVPGIRARGRQSQVVRMNDQAGATSLPRLVERPHERSSGVVRSVHANHDPAC